MKDEEKGKDQLAGELRHLRSRLVSSESRLREAEKALDALRKSSDDFKHQLEKAHQELRRVAEERKNLENALRESQKYALMIQKSPDIVYVLDSEGRFIFLEGPVEQLTGYSADELKGEHFTSLVWPEDRDKAKWRFNERRTGSRATRGYEVRLQTKRGARRHFDVRYRTVQLDAFGIWDKSVTADGKTFLGTYGVARDITAYVRLKDKARSLYEQLSEEHGQRKAFSKLLIELMEAERGKIAAELHDHIGQILVSLRMDLELMQEEAREDAAVLESRMKSAEDKAIQAIQHLRSIAYGLKPAMLETVGLVDSLHALCDEIKKQTGMTVHLFASEIPKGFDRAKELALFRIAQEALTNAVKHSRAGEIHVSLIQKEGAMSLSVEDDGTGFDLEERKRAGSRITLGLYLMEERAAQFDGKFSVESTKGRGTYISAEIPVSQ